MGAKTQARKQELETLLKEEALTMTEALAYFAELEELEAEAEDAALRDMTDARLCARFNCAL